MLPGLLLLALGAPGALDGRWVGRYTLDGCDVNATR